MNEKSKIRGASHGRRDPTHKRADQRLYELVGHGVANDEEQKSGSQSKLGLGGETRDELHFYTF
jgi:hypothetical protein